MKLIEKILVGTDFSPSSDAALEQAIRVSKKFQSSIILVHIIPETDMTNLSEEMIRDVVEKEIQSIAERLIDEGITVKTMVEKGIPFIQIMKIAELQDVNVIFIGSGNDKNKAVGTTAEKLMHKSIKPVWITPINTKPEFHNILCPVDFSEASDRALENAIHLSRQFDLDLTVLHVIDHRLPLYLTKKIGLSSGPEALRRERLMQLESNLQRFDFFNIRWKKILSEGSPSEEIIRQAQLHAADLVLMGSVGHTAHPKMLSGKTARGVFQAIPSAMITFKSENIVQLKLESELNDIRDRFQQGMELMENGFVPEAIAHFKYCLNEDPLFAPAWELLADAHDRLGKEQKAIEYKTKAAEIRNKLWSQQVEAEIKSRHTLYKLK